MLILDCTDDSGKIKYVEDSLFSTLNGETIGIEDKEKDQE